MTLSPLASAFDLDSQTLRVIAAIAEYGSITRAAAVLGFSQPAVSQQLRRVESRIGMPLVTRSGRGIRLTDAGEVLARHAGVVLDALDEAAGELSDLSGLRSGQVRLSAFPSASSTIVPHLIQSMGAEHAGVQFTYLEAEPPAAVASVRDGVSDIAIAFHYPADRSDPFEESTEGLVVHELARDDLLVLVPEGHGVLGAATTRIDETKRGVAPVAGASVAPSPARIDIAELRTENWIAGCPRCRSHLLDSCARRGFAPTIAFETDNFVAVMSMVAAGLGVALLPALARAASPIPPGVVALPSAANDHRMIVAVTRPGADQMPAVGETLRLLRAVVA
ncbi:LysR family transcriptional regulator [Herbiconiux sp. CPCC 205763]|uniref:LysR family transcriptional regulator n=1 Tax=Herbiconiux aconitum TaxID=2970913 RepID=A0ABT2GMS1_9MICO|nr:LysR family transcriptional regulator [Herbiconiux aconitum]MCS5717473.1 LysR family transcriptional regulator [Herbiconiux aconitum]